MIEGYHLGNMYGRLFFLFGNLCGQPPEKPGMWLRLAYLEYYDFEVLCVGILSSPPVSRTGYFFGFFFLLLSSSWAFVCLWA